MAAMTSPDDSTSSGLSADNTDAGKVSAPPPEPRTPHGATQPAGHKEQAKQNEAAQTTAESAKQAGYHLPLPQEGPATSENAPVGIDESLGRPLLAENIRWFCRFRWIIVSILAVFGILGVTGIVELVGLRTPGVWPFGTAAVLILCNIGYLNHARRTSNLERLHPVTANLWAQIILDLLVLTMVVHFVGSRSTLICFVYMFHIVLACIFFSWSHSLLVTAIACLLFVSCIIVEHAGLVVSEGIYPDPQRVTWLDVDSVPGVLNIISAPVIWLVVWYFGAHLSSIIRKRDKALIETNRQLIETHEETARHMLHTTHELKAPFDAIQANALLLLEGRCDPASDQGRQVVERIVARCRSLSTLIADMLQLARLSSGNRRLAVRKELDISELLGQTIEQVQIVAQQRNITVHSYLRSARTTGAADHIKALFANLLNNAVHYSYEGGTVHVRCSPGPEQQPIVSIADEGIGIPADKISHVFEEHYRTEEAIRHNRRSSGLGLAIVRRVVEFHGINLRLKSQPGVGTTFELEFPAITPPPDPAQSQPKRA